MTLPGFRHVPHLTRPDRISTMILEHMTGATVWA
jgi:hypothetical protein